MRISELFGSTVVDGDGARVGRVHDVRLGLAPGGRGWGRLRVVGLVVGPAGPLARAAHAWGYAEGRAEAPWVLRALTAGAIRRSRFVPADRVRDWAESPLRIEGSGEELEPLIERLSR